MLLFLLQKERKHVQREITASKYFEFTYELMKRTKEEMFMKESVFTCHDRQENLRKQTTEHKGGRQ